MNKVIRPYNVVSDAWGQDFLFLLLYMWYKYFLKKYLIPHSFGSVTMALIQFCNHFGECTFLAISTYAATGLSIVSDLQVVITFSVREPVRGKM